MEIIKSKTIRNETDLLFLTWTQSEDGLNELKGLISSNPECLYRELISKTWKRISRVICFSQGDCVEKCEGKLYDSTK